MALKVMKKHILGRKCKNNRSWGHFDREGESGWGGGLGVKIVCVWGGGGEEGGGIPSPSSL